MNEPPVYVIVAFPAIVAALIGLAALCLRFSSFYRQVIASEESSSRFHSIDGLRGMLAIGVFLHHSVITYYFHKTGVWTIPPSRLSTLLGQGGVAVFFMITAFLFWSRPDMHVSGGIRRFYWSRITRLCPMYLVASLSVILVAIALTHFRLAVSAKDLASQVMDWIAFTIPGTPDVNGFQNTNLINGVFWTLTYEWKFYLALPFLLVFRAIRPFTMVAAVTAVFLLLSFPESPCWYFLWGAISAVLSKEFPVLRRFAASPIALLVAAVSLGLVYVTQVGAYNPTSAALLFLPFLIIANGNTALGFLTLRPVRALGLISYSVYLMHCTFLYLGFRVVSHETSVAALSPIAFWSIVCGIGIVVVGSSFVTYRHVEYRYAKRSMPRWMIFDVPKKDTSSELVRR